MRIYTSKEWDEILDTVFSRGHRPDLSRVIGSRGNPDENDVPAGTPPDAVVISDETIAAISDAGLETLAMALALDSEL